jgi:hypothetical protein
MQGGEIVIRETGELSCQGCRSGRGPNGGQIR